MAAIPDHARTINGAPWPDWARIDRITISLDRAAREFDAVVSRFTAAFGNGLPRLPDLDGGGMALGLGRVPVELRAEPLRPRPRLRETFSGLMSRRPIRPVRRESRGPSWRGRRRALRRRGRVG